MVEDALIDDAFISFMLYYMHMASGITLTLSMLVFYLIRTRTPQSGRALAKHLMIVQVLITLNDFHLGVLLCGIPLFPLPDGICEGLLCRMGVPGHIGLTLLYFSLAHTGASILFCFHIKHRAVAELTTFPMLSPSIFRAFVLVVVSISGGIFAFAYSAAADGRAYVVQEFPAYAWIYTRNWNIFTYSFSDHMPLLIAVYVPSIAGMALVVLLCLFFVFHTFYLLSQHALRISIKTRALQRKLTITLAIQMSLPLGVQIVPCAYYGLAVLTAKSTPIVTNIFFCVQLLHAPLHSILLIATTPSYREPFLRLLRRTPFLTAMGATDMSRTAPSAIRSTDSLNAQRRL